MFMYIYDGKEAERKVDENIDDEEQDEVIIDD